MSKELCPYPEGEHKDDNLVKSFLEYTYKYQSEQGTFDYLIIPGDITNNSNLIEYDCGYKFLDKVSSKLGISQEKIIFVPGNHDVDWSVLKGIPESEVKFRKSHKWNTLKDKDHIFSKLTGDSLLQEPFIKKWEFSNIIFYGFNSSWHDDSENEKHYGQILPEHIEALRKDFDETNLNKLKIFVVHHHLQQFENPHPDWVDISIMQNSQLLMNLLSEYSFNFIIHGHRHVPNFLSTSINGFNPIHILCSGSYSCEVPTQIAGYVGNLFHIIEVDHYSESSCKGNVISLAYDRRTGWINSRENHGIEHKNPFGIEENYSKIKNSCVAEINRQLTSKPYIGYQDLISVLPDLNYLPLLSKKKLLADVQMECKVKVMEALEELIILKN